MTQKMVITRTAAAAARLVIMLGMLFVVATTLKAQSSGAVRIRQDLRSLHSLGVYDLITFQVNPDASVTLAGYVTSPAIKKDAERILENDNLVNAKIENKIEVAPMSITDQNLRNKVFTAIYRDKFLSKYGTAADVGAAGRARESVWGSAYGDFGEMHGSRWTGAPFYGQEPIGGYAIHILVKRGVVTLVGVVESEEDKDQAGRDAKRVHGLIDLNNDLHVQPKS